MEERQITRDEHADRVGVVAPDRVGETHRMNEPGPTRSTIAPCEHELRVGQRRGGGLDRSGMVLTQFGDRFHVAGEDATEEFLGLAMKLLQIGANWQ